MVVEPMVVQEVQLDLVVVELVKAQPTLLLIEVEMMEQLTQVVVAERLVHQIQQVHQVVLEDQEW